MSSDELLKLLRLIWPTGEASDRHKQLDKCGIKSLWDLRRCINTPLKTGFSDKEVATNPDALYRKGACLLNVLLVRNKYEWIEGEILVKLTRAASGSEIEKGDLSCLCRLFCESEFRKGCTSYNPEEVAEALRGAAKVKSQGDVRRLAGIAAVASASAVDGSEPCPSSPSSSLLCAALSRAQRPWSEEQVDMLQGLSRIVVHEGGELLFTAPHGVFLERDGSAPHKPEDWTTFLARRLALAVGGTFVVWCDTERCKSEYLRKPDPFNRDPNYLARADLSRSPWNVALSYHKNRFGVRSGELSTACLHVDLHGKRDPGPNIPVDDSDCDIGVAALAYYEGVVGADGAVEWRVGHSYADRGECPPVFPPGLAQCIKASLAQELRDFFNYWCPDQRVFTVNEEPRLNGFRSGSNRFTLSRQGVEHGLVSVQLELTKRLRRSLKHDEYAQARFAEALKTAWQNCISNFPLNGYSRM